MFENTNRTRLKAHDYDFSAKLKQYDHRKL